ncbi:dihydrodipicolinate synthase family protein [Ruminococcaceae bacterium OttesenSCG-928-A16]|nr:dihydrodipicolinate synthase family protein [Ruminococcaceae bacterium OttesenSCG-928-A16]
MRNIEKYKGIIPAFYACYNQSGDIDDARTAALAHHLVNKGVKGLYLCGSSGECIYQTVEERKRIAETVVKAVGGKTTLIVHVGGVGTRDAAELARHAESLGVDAVASIPPIYFRLPDRSIAKYWNDISAAAPHTDFIIYNIPQLAGVSLNGELLQEMLKNERLVGVKNSSMPVQDIELFKTIGGEDFVIFNGPDEQYAAGRLLGADAGIGGTYGVMPELFMAIDQAMSEGNVAKMKKIQSSINRIVELLVGCKGNLYAALKGVLRLQGVEVGTVRAPLADLDSSDFANVEKAHEMICLAKDVYAV